MAAEKHNPDQTIVRVVDELIAHAITRKASDVHLEPDEAGLRVRFRLDGVLHDTDLIPSSLSPNVIGRLKVLAGLLTYRIDVPQEGSFHLNGRPGGALDLRVATFPTVRGERAAVRILYQVGQVSGLEELGVTAAVLDPLRRAAERPQGLILVTGPAGSGKSTTLYALARHVLSVTPGRSVVSLEDPVEQRVAGMAQIQVTPYGDLDYVRAMRSLLRQDVQVLLVGEIRDAATAHIVVEASLTGHLIMSTLHSGDPAEGIVRLLEMGIAPYQLVGAMTVVCSQRLLRLVCVDCAGSGRAGEGECPGCAGTGYRGRTACGQVAVMDDSVREAVLARATAGRLREILATKGPDLLADARRLLQEKRTTEVELRRVLGTDAATE